MLRQLLSLSVLIIGFFITSPVHATEKPLITITYYDNYAPYSWIDDHGRVRGVFIDVLNEVFDKRMQLEVKHIALPWRRAQLLVENGIADAMIAPITEERLNYAHASTEPFLTSKFVLITRKDHPRLEDFSSAPSLASLNSHHFVTQMGDGWAEENLHAYHVSYTSDLDAVLDMLVLGRADLFVEDELVSAYNIKTRNLEKQILQVPNFRIKDAPYHLFISKKSKLANLMTQYEATFKDIINDGTLESIVRSYSIQKTNL